MKVVVGSRDMAACAAELQVVEAGSQKITGIQNAPCTHSSSKTVPSLLSSPLVADTLALVLQHPDLLVDELPHAR
ncbi:hypothetical protein LIER_01750 [Lithospermum erythrorhizon]|uniref:Uncharacterized protein n=1 Tax=Lithospermum erythrorhizon TaxID=34254 RepID=A0AAV3NN45_LITER